MRSAALSLAILLLASPVAPSDIDETRTTLREHILKMINRDRQLYELPPVELDVQVSAMGDEYCRQQIRNGTNGHYSVDGLSPYMRYSLAGLNDGVTENAAAWSANYAFSERALYEMAGRSEDAMMAETAPRDGHKKAILDPHATHVGIGLAWERGEFRLVQQFVRRYVQWTRTPRRHARPGETPVIAGVPLEGAMIEAISVHHEDLPQTMPAAVANAMESYSLPDRRKDYLPRLRQDYKHHPNGTVEMVRRQYAGGHRGDFYTGKDGAFSFPIPFTEGPGMYTVVVWVRRGGTSVPIAASNISIRVEETAAGSVGATARR